MEVPLPTAGAVHIQKDTQETAVPHTTVHLQDIEEAHRKVMREVHTEEVQQEAVDTEEAVALLMVALLVGIAEAVAHLMAAHQAAVIAVAHTAAVLQVVEDIGEDK